MAPRSRTPLADTSNRRAARIREASNTKPGGHLIVGLPGTRINPNESEETDMDENVYMGRDNVEYVVQYSYDGEDWEDTADSPFTSKKNANRYADAWTLPSQVRVAKRTLEVLSVRCPKHPPYTPDNCPLCGTAARIN